MKKLLVATALVLGSFAAPVWAQATSADIVGRYVITKGVNMDGSTYDGTVQITPDASGGVSVRWDDGSVGLGLIEGNKLYVGMVYEKRSVVMSMTINADKTISGKWIQRTQPGTGLETWKKQ